jgi:enoyl-CoA hydratase/carnithine racemase
MMADIVRAWELFHVDDRVKAIVVTGHGKMFCAGADLATGFRRNDDNINAHRDG